MEWKDIKNKLKDDEVAVEFASFHFSNTIRSSDTVFYVAILLKKNMPLPGICFALSCKLHSIAIAALPINKNEVLSDRYMLLQLSTCETGLGEIHGSEGVYGLQRVFKIAGVQNLVISLWKVSDLKAAEFMKAVYKNLFAQQSISNAFYNTQKAMENK